MSSGKSNLSGGSTIKQLKIFPAIAIHKHVALDDLITDWHKYELFVLDAQTGRTNGQERDINNKR